MTDAYVCSRCGARGAADDPATAMTWTRSVDDGVTHVYCPQCPRDHLRSIEAKLDEQYW
jgi:predicted RNA-binding Zn-ribbon protein involved in translation (DUF1610 family)